MERLYWINVGRGQDEGHDQLADRWRAWCMRGFASVGFLEDPAKAKSTLSGFEPGDRLLAYVSGSGAVGSGVVRDGLVRELLDVAHVPPLLGRHRHVIAVEWDRAIDDVNAAVRAEVLRKYGLFHPSSTRQRIEQADHVAAAHRVIGELMPPFPGTGTAAFPEEIETPERYPEGALQRIAVNRFERDAAARAECLRHYERRCIVCRLDPVQRYGPVGARAIHVHHLRPLSDVRAEYHVDPISDLRPVCPTCHAVIHSRTPPYSPDEVQAMLRPDA